MLAGTGHVGKYIQRHGKYLSRCRGTTVVKFPTKITVSAKVMSAPGRRDYLRQQILN